MHLFKFLTQNDEPYRLFFPCGTFCLLVALAIWVPQIWEDPTYPLEIHRSFILNGFLAFFIAGFLMTAIPQFSKTKKPSSSEFFSFLAITLLTLFMSFTSYPTLFLSLSALQALLLLLFMFRRLLKRQSSPPYSFSFVLIGLLVWPLSNIMVLFYEQDLLKELHHEAMICALILGVGARLIPGILGHTEIVQAQRNRYESQKSLIRSIPIGFSLLILAFVSSYTLPSQQGSLVRAIVVLSVALFYWRIYKWPKTRSSLTWSLWSCSLLIVLSFIAKVFLIDAGIHITHSFFISGVTLLSLLIATRVLCAHGPKDKTLENSKSLYVISALVILSGLTRVSAYYMPDAYFTHLGYSASLLIVAISLWGFKYLRYINTGENL